MPPPQAIPCRTARPSRALCQFQHRGPETQRHREIAPRALRTPRTPRAISSASSRRALASACRSADGPSAPRPAPMSTQRHRDTEAQRNRTQCSANSVNSACDFFCALPPRRSLRMPFPRAAASACRSARHSSGTILAKGLSPETDAAPCVPGTPPPQGVIGGGWETSDADEVPRSGFNSQLIASGHENPHRYVSKGAENCMGQPGSSVSNLLSFQYRPHPNHSHFSSASFFALRCRCRFQRP